MQVLDELLTPTSPKPESVPCPDCGAPLEQVYVMGSWKLQGCLPCHEKRELNKAAVKEYYKLEEIEKNIEDHLHRAGVPGAYLKKSFDNYQGGLPAEITQFGKRGLFMFGPSGTGKTHLACAIMRLWIMQGNKAQFYGLPRLMIQIKDSFKHETSLSEFGLLKMAATVPLLVLDDLGQEVLSSWLKSTVYSIINEREYEGKPYIITSNMSLLEIASAYSPQIADRIAGGCYVLNLKGKSKRTGM